MAQHDTRDAAPSNRPGQTGSQQDQSRQRETMQRAQTSFYERNDLTGLRPDSDDRYRVQDDEYASVYGRHLRTDSGRYDSLRARTEGLEQDFRGRGPKGYQRTDERILEEVCERLTDDPQLDASDIEVTCAAGEITLEGSVGSRADKRHAERLAEHCSGVIDVHNRLTVTRMSH